MLTLELSKRPQHQSFHVVFSQMWLTILLREFCFSAPKYHALTAFIKNLGDTGVYRFAI